MKKVGIIVLGLGLALLFFAFPVNAQNQLKATQDFTMRTGESDTWIGDEVEFTITVNQFRGDFQTVEGVDGVNLTIEVKDAVGEIGEFQDKVYLTKDRPVSFGEYKVSLDSVNSISNTRKKEMEGCEAVPGSPGMPEQLEEKENPSEREVEQEKAPALGPCEQYFSDGEATFVLERKEYNKSEYLDKFETVDYKKRFIRVVFEPWMDLEQTQKFVGDYAFANIVEYESCPETPVSSEPGGETPVESCDKEDKFEFSQGIRGSAAKLIVKEGQEKEMADKLFDSEKVLYVEPVQDIRPLKEMTSESKNLSKEPQKETQKKKGSPLMNFFSGIGRFFSNLFSGLF